MSLALANLWHHKVRSVLSALAVGIGVAMLVTLLGLTHGSLNEVTRRMVAVDADLLAVPHDWNVVIGASGAPLSDRQVDMAREVAGVDRVAPVFREMMAVGPRKQMHAAFGIRPRDWPVFLGPGKKLEGSSFPDLSAHEERLFALRDGWEQADRPSLPMTAEPLRDLGGALELVIDERLAAAEKLAVGDSLEAWGCRFRIVGIAPTGVPVRIFLPLETVRLIKDRPRGATFLFVKLKPGTDAERAREELGRAIGAKVLTISEYGDLLAENLSTIPDFTLALSLVTLVVAFLFVLVIMYTVVIQRTREIGILKALGARRRFIVRTVLAESLTLSLAGTVLGLALSFAARAAILHYRPLLTVDLNGRFLLAGVATGLIGGLLSGLYPAVVAARQDPVSALSFE